MRRAGSRGPGESAHCGSGREAGGGISAGGAQGVSRAPPRSNIPRRPAGPIRRTAARGVPDCRSEKTQRGETHCRRRTHAHAETNSFRQRANEEIDPISGVYSAPAARTDAPSTLRPRSSSCDSTWRCCPAVRNLTAMSPQLPEFVEADSELSKNFVKKGRSDDMSTVDWDRNRAPVLMDPALMASCLPVPFKTKPRSGATQLLSAGARHSRSQCCLPAGIAPSRGIQPQSFQTRSRVQPRPLPASA